MRPGDELTLDTDGNIVEIRFNRDAGETIRLPEWQADVPQTISFSTGSALVLAGLDGDGTLTLRGSGEVVIEDMRARAIRLDGGAAGGVLSEDRLNVRLYVRDDDMHADPSHTIVMASGGNFEIRLQDGAGNVNVDLEFEGSSNLYMHGVYYASRAWPELVTLPVLLMWDSVGNVYNTNLMPGGMTVFFARGSSFELDHSALFVRSSPGIMIGGTIGRSIVIQDGYVTFFDLAGGEGVYTVTISGGNVDTTMSNFYIADNQQRNPDNPGHNGRFAWQQDFPGRWVRRDE